MMPCAECDGAEVVAYPGGMRACPNCAGGWVPPTCRAPACIQPFACNTAGRCPMASIGTWRWERMKPGDTDLISMDDAAAAQKSIHSYQARTGFKRTFITRTCPDGLRVWCIT